MTILAIIGIIIFASLSFLGYQVWKAPMGWEDSDGFHIGEQE